MCSQRGRLGLLCQKYVCSFVHDRSGQTSQVEPAFVRIRGPSASAKIAAMTTNVSSVDDTMPPIIGAAMRCMTSDRAPVLHMTGNRPAMMAATVIIFGRTRSSAPSMIAPHKSALVKSRPSSLARRRQCILQQRPLVTFKLWSTLD